jgi:hypothetical protein
MTDSERTIHGDDEIDLNDEDESTSELQQNAAELKLHHGADDEIYKNGRKEPSGPSSDSLDTEKRDQSKPYQVNQGQSPTSASLSEVPHSSVSILWLIYLCSLQSWSKLRLGVIKLCLS